VVCADGTRSAGEPGIQRNRERKEGEGSEKRSPYMAVQENEGERIRLRWKGEKSRVKIWKGASKAPTKRITKESQMGHNCRFSEVEGAELQEEVDRRAINFLRSYSREEFSSIKENYAWKISYNVVTEALDKNSRK